MATFNGHIDIVRLLLEKGANTEAQDKVRKSKGVLCMWCMLFEFSPSQ